jgi:hypothetical protein
LGQGNPHTPSPGWPPQKVSQATQNAVGPNWAQSALLVHWPQVPGVPALMQRVAPSVEVTQAQRTWPLLQTCSMPRQ